MQHFLTKKQHHYGIVVGESLYGQYCVMRFSGVGKYSRAWRPLVCADELEAQRQAARLLKKKTREGYSEN